MLGVAMIFSVTLVVANRKLAVEVDPRQQEIEALLPQANCGGCGYASCSAYAEAAVGGTAPADGCTVGGPAVAEGVAGVLGADVVENFPYRPVIHCGATRANRLKQGHYIGEPTCTAAQVVGGVQGCTYGCLGLGDCVDRCAYDAMELIDGLPRINYQNCIGCGACVRACPLGIIEQVPFKVDRMLVVACSNHDPLRAVRSVCEVGCLGCSACARVQPELFSVQNGLSVIDYANYTGDEDFEPVLKKCPRESLIVFGQPSPRQEEELADVDAVTWSGRPELPQRPTEEDMNWRG